MKFKLIFFVIFLLALVLRIYKLDSIPPALNWDEISLGYNSYSILKTGKDEWGQNFPLSFRAYGDYKLPGYVYLDVPFVAIFGLNEWAVRLPSALLGAGLVVLIFFILKELVDKKTALWGMFLAALLPWGIITSRIALEAELALFLTTAAVYCFFVGLKEQKLLLLSGLLFGLTIFSYNSSRVVTPLLLVVLTTCFWRELRSSLKPATLAGFIFLIFFIVALPFALLQDSSARYRWTAILDEGAINKINERRSIIYNKVTYFTIEAGKNYLSHLTPNFLFLNGGSNYQFSVPGQGFVYPVLAPFLLLGLWIILKTRQKWQLVVLGWLLVSFIPAAITRDSPHALRSIMATVPLIIISSLGIIWLKNYQKAIVATILLISLYMFLQNYSGDYTKNYSWSWQYGYKEAVEFIKEHYNNYDQVIMTKKYGEPHEFVLFYLSWDPGKYRNDSNLIRYHQSDWYWVDHFDKFYFINDWEISKSSEQWAMESGGVIPVTGKTLLITSPDNYPLGWSKIKTINFKDGKVAFEILERSN